MASVTPPPRRATVSATGILSIVAGAAIFALVLWNQGPSEIWEGITRMRWWLLAVIALGGLRFLSRAIAWRACIEPPHRLPIGTAFSGVVAGDTISNATPLGPVLGEPAKAAYATGPVPIGTALTALAIENIFYTLSAAAMIAAGTLALLFVFNPPPEVRYLGEASVAVIVLVFATALVLMWRRPAIVSRLLPLVTKGGKDSEARRERLRALEQEIYSFASRRTGSVVAVVASEGMFHALGILEAHLTLTILNGGQQPPILTSFILETANRLLAVLFRFIPFQLGVGEAGLAVVTDALGLGGTVGVTISVIRKARMAVWAVVGVVLLVVSRKLQGLRT